MKTSKFEEKILISTSKKLNTNQDKLKDIHNSTHSNQIIKKQRKNSANNKREATYYLKGSVNKNNG